MIPRLNGLIRSLRMRASEKYHSRVVRYYWEHANKTHADMSDESFAFYSARIAELLGSPAAAGSVLDHGAGDARIGALLIALGYDVEFSEFALQHVERIASAGHLCYRSDAVPEGRFDTIFVNNAIFYVHPLQLVREIHWLLGRLRADGRLLLLDVPTIQRAHRLGGGLLRSLIRKLTMVYQAQAGGFFLDEESIARAFSRVQIRPSWCDYRVHIEIHR